MLRCEPFIQVCIQSYPEASTDQRHGVWVWLENSLWSPGPSGFAQELILHRNCCLIIILQCVESFRLSIEAASCCLWYFSESRLPLQLINYTWILWWDLRRTWWPAGGDRDWALQTGSLRLLLMIHAWTRHHNLKHKVNESFSPFVLQTTWAFTGLQVKADIGNYKNSF